MNKEKNMIKYFEKLRDAVLSEDFFATEEIKINYK